MKILYKVVLFSVVLLSAISCASYSAKWQEEAITFPELGSFSKIKGDFWYTSTMQIGSLTFDKPLLVSHRELPFNKDSYSKYTKYLTNANRINSVAYTDSMPFKPKYIRLQLQDQIALTTLLNNQENSNIRSYLKNDAAYKLISQIDVTVTDELRILFSQAKTVMLHKDANAKLSLQVDNGQGYKIIDLSHLEVFSYDYVSFCWGEDLYHNKIIKVLVEGASGCPESTYKKASKVKSLEKSYLKL